MRAAAKFPDPTLRRSNLFEFSRSVKKHWELLAMLIIPVVWFITYSYVPIYGITLAFKRYMVLQGIVGSPGVGLEHFERLLGSSKFYQVLGNTFILAFLRLIFFMPCPIIFALLLNEVRILPFKKGMQTVTYLPYFLSWVVVAGIVRNLLSPVNGLFNYFIVAFGDKPLNFLLDPDFFRPIVIISSIWRESGWGSIIILAAIANIDPDLYAASEIDGGNRRVQARHITLPGILPMVLMIYVLRTGDLITVGFDQIMNLYNPAVYRVADIVSTYTYRVGLVEFNYAYATAIGLFMNIIAFVMLASTNWVARRIDVDSALW